MNLPNKLTMFRVVLIPVFLILYLAKPFGELSGPFALLVFCVASLTDALDGHLARKHNLVTNFGKLMDPLADKLLVISALVAMIETGIVPAWIVIVVISRELAITGFRQLAVEQGKVIAASKLAKFKTISQMVFIIYALLGYFPLFNMPLMFIMVALTALSGIEYIYKNWDIVASGGM